MTSDVELTSPIKQRLRECFGNFGLSNAHELSYAARAHVPKPSRRGRCRADRVAAMRDLQRP
jgi:hypothetical protein